MLTRRSVLAGASAAIVAGAAPRSAWGQTHADVVIIGAGLAGLFAAHRLEVAGLKAVIVEANGRVGGRLHTLDDLPGRPEAGGIQVGSGYKRLRAIADNLKVPLIAGGEEGRAALYRINGQTVREEDWATSPANKTAGAERAIVPGALGQFYGAKLPRLDKPEDWMKLETIRALDVPWKAKLREFGASTEAQRLIGANLNGNDIETLSALHLARSSAIFRAGPGPVMLIGGGSQRLPEAMAKALASPIRLNAAVMGIEELPEGVRVTLASGETIQARHAICTIPFSAMRGIKRVGSTDPLLDRAIARLGYTRGAFVYLQASEPFWKSDGAPGTLWTDDPLLGRVFVLGDNPAMLKVFALGKVADRLDRLSSERAGAEAIRRIEAARPSAKGKLRLAKMLSWQKQPTARGIYHHLSPGMAATMVALVQRDEGRLRFAGEHLAISSSGMEAALESGERVARSIVARA